MILKYLPPRCQIYSIGKAGGLVLKLSDPLSAEPPRFFYGPNSLIPSNPWPDFRNRVIPLRFHGLIIAFLLQPAIDTEKYETKPGYFYANKDR